MSSSDPAAVDGEEEITSPIAPGEVLDDKFRIEHIIGIGAIGLVVQATHLKLGEQVAIKFLRPTKKDRKDQIVRFQREARAAARLKGEHVARVMDVGLLPSGEPFMVMECLEGRDLENYVETQGPILNLATAALYTIQACEALAEAHALGIIHRDIKPANLFLHAPPGGLPMIKLLDFGISKAALTGEYTNIALAETKTTAIMGTPFYMAPEQVRSTKDVDTRADIWALGAVLYEIVTGKTMWRAHELGALVQEILRGSPIPIQEMRPDVPDAFAQALQGAFARDPNARYQNAALFARALLPFAPSTAIVHVERAERFAQSAAVHVVPTLRTAKTDALSSTNGAIEAASREDDAPERSTGSRVFGIAVGVSILMVLGAATAILAPRWLHAGETNAAPGSSSINANANAPPPSAETLPTNNLGGGSLAPPTMNTTTTTTTTPGPTTPTSSGGMRPTAAGGGGGRPGWPPPSPRSTASNQDLPATTNAPIPIAPLDPIPTPATGNSSGRPKGSMDDNPWGKAGGTKPKLDDMNK